MVFLLSLSNPFLVFFGTDGVNYSKLYIGLFVAKFKNNTRSFLGWIRIRIEKNCRLRIRKKLNRIHSPASEQSN